MFGRQEQEHPRRSLLRPAHDASTKVRARVARNKHAPQEATHALASEPDAKVRRLVAEHPNTADQTLDDLAADPDAEVRRLVAEHRNTALRSPTTICLLAGLNSRVLVHHCLPCVPEPPLRALSGRLAVG